MMAPSTSGHTSSSLQIPTTDPNYGSSRHHHHSSSSAQSPPSASSASRPISVAAHTSSSQNQQSTSSRRQQRASHTVVSASQSQANGNSQHDDSNPPLTDVYNHPAAVAYAAAHPRRTIPRFGPYLLLQTLGEGEFGKVKLGLHCQWGEEVAVKLIRRGNVDSTVRMSKVEREIEVLKTLKHPNIVRLYDVIETDKYIGIILEYASGGELFDHILAHRYLRERDAAKLFSQLISGVWYIHQKKIVHRDLKLENLLLDRHRNVIITDFGFANRFEHRSDDLMQTSCGSPCYAAPELVISEGLYVGSAVDIWSCGVILYAMLAGYLPFDDDPANPDGDNINLLYKYIVSTPLSFPDYVSAEARDLLSMMLVPDPTRRTTLDGVMRHPWLGAYHSTRTDGQPNAFGKTVEELEKAAMEQHHQKRIAYQRQMRANASTNGTSNAVSPSRTQSHRPDYSTAPTTASRSRSTQPEYLYDSSVDQSTMSPAAGGVAATPTQSGAPRKTYGSPAALGLAEDDPFAGPGGSSTVNSASNTITPKVDSASASLSPNATSKGKGSSHGTASSGGGFRHTIQVEYDDPSSKPKRRERAGSQGQSNAPAPQEQQQQQPQQVSASPSVPSPAVPVGHTKERRGSQSSTKPLPPSPLPPTSYRAPVVTSPAPTTATPPKAHRPPELNGALLAAEPLVVNVSSPPATPSATSTDQQLEKDSGSQNSGSSTKRGHKKGKSSIDKLGLSKIFGSNNSSSPTTTPSIPTSITDGTSTPTKQSSGSTSSVPLNVTPDGRGSSQTSVLLSPGGTEKESGGRKSRRNTLTVMVEPFRSTIRNRTKGKTTSTPMTTEGASAANGGKTKETPSPQIPSAVLPPPHATAPADAPVFIANGQDLANANGLQASTNKARKVMQWFRTKSKGRDSIGFGADEPEPVNEKVGTPTQGKYYKGFSASSSTINQQTPSTNPGLKESAMSPVPVVVTPSTSARPRPAPLNGGHPQRSASSTTSVSAVGSSFVNRVRNSVVVGGGGSHHHDKSHPYGQLRIHHGAVDQTTITTRPPPEVMAHVRKVLEGMGVEIQQESEYKYRCIRGKKRKGTMSNLSSAPSNSGSGSPGSLAAVTMVGSAASNGIDKRGLPLPSPSAFGSGGMLRGLLMRRQSSQVSSHGPASSQPSLAFDDETSVVVSEPMVMGAPGSVETAYGDPTQDAGDEVRFSVELTRLDRLNDTFSLDIRRLKGNLRSYKYLYDTVREEPILNVHRGAIDAGFVISLTRISPFKVMERVTERLRELGVHVEEESKYNYLCTRPKKAEDGGDKTLPSTAGTALYGATAADNDLGGEVRFSVELTTMQGLPGTYSLDIRRLKGNVRSYSFIYNALRE
ncbi:hypothetical protein CVT24_008733 [Panaeolus cyanescens]|uniref:non-specific serine/threonine protein kinase n=1 Tax=Panaeolus cyanescens TaxID=181874 RepID=A0A409VB22_9AGAR|nr:hypothetical protein CVT24_008733 [Panaeolus cyanescens]